MNPHPPALILTDPRCVTTVLPHGIATALSTHHAFAASRQPAPGSTGEPTAHDSRITGDDYW